MKIFLPLLSFCILFYSCEEENKVKSIEKEVRIDSMQLESSMRLGDIANFKIYFSYENPCATFSRLESSTIKDTTFLKAYGNYREGNCLNIEQKDSTYINYEARTLGVKYFKWKQLNGQVKVDSFRVVI